MISIEKSSGLVIVGGRLNDRAHLLRAASGAALRASCAVQFSTITMVASAISPMAIASPASENRLIVWPNAASGRAVNSVPSSSTQTGADGGADVSQRHGNDEDDDEQLVDDGLEEVRQRVPDQRRAVVGRDDLDALRERGA